MTAAAAKKPVAAVAPVADQPQPMEVETSTTPSSEETNAAVTAPSVAEEPKAAPAATKKKKKKTSYKAMMAAMTTAKEVDIEKEKESIRKATGGGAFSKIDKI